MEVTITVKKKVKKKNSLGFKAQSKLVAMPKSKSMIYKEYSLFEDIMEKDARGRKKLQEHKLEELREAL